MDNKLIKTFLALTAADAVLIGTWVYGKTQYYKGRSSAFKEATEKLNDVHNEIEKMLKNTESEEP